MNDQKREITVELDEDYQTGMKAINEMFEVVDNIVEDHYLFTKEEILEVLKDYNNFVKMIFVAGTMSIESQILIQDVEQGNL